MISDQLDRLCDIVLDHSYLCDFSSRDYLVKYPWNDEADCNSSIPEDWLACLSGLGTHDLLELAIKNNSENNDIHPSLLTFISEVREHSLCRRLADQRTQHDPIRVHDNLKRGMSPKKHHECLNIATFLNNFIPVHTDNDSGSFEFIDVGCGKGYLSTVLSYQLGHRVLAVDRDTVQISGITKRNCSVNTASEISKLEIFQQDVVDKGLSNITALIGESKQGFLCSLHSCGNLSLQMLDTFLTDENVRGMLNIGCCYNIIDADNFPVSSHLRIKGFKLDSRARMLACQNVYAWEESDACSNFETTVKKLAYRAILQAILVDYSVIETKDDVERLVLGKVNDKNFDTLFRYLGISLKKIQETVQLNETQLSKLQKIQENISHISEIYESKCMSDLTKQLSAIWILRIVLSNALESIIQLDRYMYMLEQCEKRDIELEFKDLMVIFDGKISARNMALVALKKTN